MLRFLAAHGFQPIRQQGSHVILAHPENENSVEIPVPKHKELSVGVTLSILKAARVSREEFARFFRRH